MIAARYHLAPAPKDPVHSLRKSRSNRLYPPRQGILSLGLDDQMKMIVLDGVLHQAKVPALTRLGKGLLHFLHQRTISKIRNTLHDTQCHMGRRKPMEPTSQSMRLMPSPDPLGPSPIARAAMPRGHSLSNDVVRELELLDYCHAIKMARTIALINSIVSRVVKINNSDHEPLDPASRQDWREVDSGEVKRSYPHRPTLKPLKTPNLTNSNYAENFASHEPEFTSRGFSRTPRIHLPPFLARGTANNQAPV